MVIDEMVLEPEVKEILDKHEDRISNLEENVTDVQSNQIRMEEQLKFISQNQQDFKDVLVQNMNILHQNMNTNNQLMTNIMTNKTQKEIAENTNSTQLQITKENNRTSLLTRGLMLFGAFWGGSKASDIWNATKDIFK